jgi:uncharacterized protein (TIGR00369 family)
MTHNAIFNRIQQSFVRSGFLKNIGAELVRAESGLCEIILPHNIQKIGNQQNMFHGGAIGALSDTAAGYASLTVAPEGMEVATVEYKINFLANMTGGELRAIGRVVKPGKRLFVCSAEIFHIDDKGKSTLCAVAQQTLMAVPKSY